ncbi:MAG TPA: hypothetical protein VMK12_31220 [Anaeromyxobacteraceae bacterium]|nr:hypothetical protein [Anaeromyxobacteraceae bacterium]
MRQTDEVPWQAVAVGVSLDGIVPMKGGERTEKGEEAATEGRKTREPAIKRLVARP